MKILIGIQTSLLVAALLAFGAAWVPTLIGIDSLGFGGFAILTFIALPISILWVFSSILSGVRAIGSQFQGLGTAMRVYVVFTFIAASALALFAVLKFASISGLS